MQKKILLLLLASVTIVSFTAPNIFAEKIHCADGVNLEKYPICKYESEWNESEKFNGIVNDKLSLSVDEINADPSSFMTIFNDTQNKVRAENPGLEEKGKDMKSWIYEQLKKKQ